VYVFKGGSNHIVPEPGNSALLILKQEGTRFTVQDKDGYAGTTDFDTFPNYLKDFNRVRAADNRQCADVCAGIMRVAEQGRLAAQARNAAVARAAEAERQEKLAALRQKEIDGARSVAFSVVRELLQNANAGMYDKAKRLMSTTLLRALDSSLGLAVGGVQGFCDKVSRDGKLDSIRFDSESIRGQGGSVSYVYTLKGATTEYRGTAKVIYEAGTWKVADID